MVRDKLNLNDWISLFARLNEELETRRRPRRRLTSLTARLSLQNWLVYRAMTLEPGRMSPCQPRRWLVTNNHLAPVTQRKKNPRQSLS